MFDVKFFELTTNINRNNNVQNKWKRLIEQMQKEGTSLILFRNQVK